MTFFSLDGIGGEVTSATKWHFWAGKSSGGTVRGVVCGAAVVIREGGRLFGLPPLLHRRWVDPATRINLAGKSSSSSSACGRRLAISGTAWSSPCPSPCPPDDDDDDR